MVATKNDLELADLAIKWTRAVREADDAAKRAQDAMRDKDRQRGLAEEIEKKLYEFVGPNTPRRLVVVPGVGVVVVERSGDLPARVSLEVPVAARDDSRGLVPVPLEVES